MRRVLIGHRGVGKTSLLKRHSHYYSEIKHFDLDFEIEASIGVNISEYFKKFGEENFRKKEHEVFQKLISKNSDFVISLGAGFDLSVLPAKTEVFFISRVTDADGRIFLNRPRLQSSLGPLEESKKLFKTRMPHYLKVAKKIYQMPEGLEVFDGIEKSILSENFEVQDAYYSLVASELSSIDTLLRCYKKIELRTDLLDPQIIQNLLNQYPHQSWLVSIRTAVKFNFMNAKNIDVDFQYYFSGCQILSSHADKIGEGIKQLDEIKEKLHLKLCPLVESFADLIKGYQWQQLDPQNRSFLPRSLNGKWVWYRQLCKFIQKINFVKNFIQIADQPSLFDWLILPNEKPKAWGAVLGKPVYFSRSPERHRLYFLERKTFFTKIEITAEEFTQYASFLVDLGMQYASVTSPLKAAAFQISGTRSDIATQLGAVNTFYIKENKIFGHNTDLLGFQKLVKNIKPTDMVAIWGGGGTLALMKNILPDAHLYSSQTGKLRDDSVLPSPSYDYLIWAAPRTELTRWPSDQLRVKAIFDLNYTENSMGLEFAANRKIDYISGAEMFNIQAQAQQEFWSTTPFVLKNINNTI